MFEIGMRILLFLKNIFCFEMLWETRKICEKNIAIFMFALLFLNEINLCRALICISFL